ncbi:MAG: hypothetical protein K2K58_10175, partial [Muribaculaceae bacterium]|nr:hypothetical protein [Muribaculaceae bacterium]
ATFASSEAPFAGVHLYNGNTIIWFDWWRYESIIFFAEVMRKAHFNGAEPLGMRLRLKNVRSNFNNC